MSSSSSTSSPPVLSWNSMRPSDLDPVLPVPSAPAAEDDPSASASASATSSSSSSSSSTDPLSAVTSVLSTAASATTAVGTTVGTGLVNVSSTIGTGLVSVGSGLATAVTTVGGAVVGGTTGLYHLVTDPSQQQQQDLEVGRLISAARTLEQQLRAIYQSYALQAQPSELKSTSTSTSLFSPSHTSTNFINNDRNDTLYDLVQLHYPDSTAEERSIKSSVLFALRTRNRAAHHAQPPSLEEMRRAIQILNEEHTRIEMIQKQKQGQIQTTGGLASQCIIS